MRSPRLSIPRETQVLSYLTYTEKRAKSATYILKLRVVDKTSSLKIIFLDVNQLSLGWSAYPTSNPHLYNAIKPTYIPGAYATISTVLQIAEFFEFDMPLSSESWGEIILYRSGFSTETLQFDLYVVESCMTSVKSPCA